MWFFSILLLCFITGKAFEIGSRVTDKHCGKSFYSQERIVGGQPLWPGDFPWMVTLQPLHDYEFQHACGASILNERWILTAAHCIFKDKPYEYVIHVGLHHLSRKSALQAKRYRISKIIKHEKFHMFTMENNVALLKTKEPIDFYGSEGYVNSVCLPAANEPLPLKEAMVAGWGRTQENGYASDALLGAIVPIIPTNVCNDSYLADKTEWKLKITENMLCAGWSGFDACQADSGGPLVMYKQGRGVLVGIVSYGNGCGRVGYPGVYTRVSSYVDWIENKILSDLS